MEILVKKDLVNNSKYLISPVGKIDTVTAVEFGTTVNDAIDDYEISELVVDFEKVTYVSSMGLRVILELQKKMMNIGYMELINVPQTVLDVFKMTGFDKILTIK